MRKDKSPRTKMISRYNAMFVTGALLAAVGGVWMGVGNAQYTNMLLRSSSPIGTQMQFKRSNAQINIVNLYTDSAHDVLIARLHMSDSDGLKVPSKGTDYKVFVASDSLNGNVGQEIPVLFGRYSVNGDFYLVIPKPTQDVYNIYIMNKNFVATDQLSDKLKSDSAGQPGSANGQASSAAGANSQQSQSDSNSNLSDSDVQNILRTSMNNFNYRDTNATSKSIDVQSDLLDVIGFRITMNPAIDSNAYKVQVLNGSLLSNDGQFNFEEFYNQAFKGASTSNLDTQYADLNNQKELLTKRVSDLTERLKSDSTNTTIKGQLNNVQSELDSVNKKLVELANTYSNYSSTTFDQSLFKNVNQKATVIGSNEIAQLNQSGK